MSFTPAITTPSPVSAGTSNEDYEEDYYEEEEDEDEDNVNESDYTAELEELRVEENRLEAELSSCRMKKRKVSRTEFLLVTLNYSVCYLQAKQGIDASARKKRPPVVLDVTNVAAKCIRAQSGEYVNWTQNDYNDDPIMSDRILGTALYIQIGSTFDLMKKFTYDASYL